MTRGLTTIVVALLAVACTATAPGVSTPPSSEPSNPPSALPSARPSASVVPASPTGEPTPASSDPAATPDASPQTPIWVELANAAGPSAREDHTWTIVDDGRALLFGGRTSEDASAELWAYDLAADEWSLLQPSGAAPAARFGHTATWVPGKGLVIWSGQAGSTFFDDIWAYDPSANAWTQLPAQGEVPLARYGSCASLGPDGRLWISHGFTQDSGRFSDTRAYDFASATWADETPADSVPVERCLHECLWSAGRLVIYAGQTTGVPALGDIWAFDPASSTWTRGPKPDAAARQLYALADLGDERALVVGGGSIERGYLGDVWQIDTQTLVFTPLEPTTAAPPARSGATIVTDHAHGRVLLFGGQDDGGLRSDLWALAGLL